MKTNDRVKLIAFNGKVRPRKSVVSSENYWKLVGETGTIQQDPKESSIYANFSRKKRVLVKFDKNLNDFGLIAHNNIENSLWILASDLQVVENNTKN